MRRTFGWGRLFANLFLFSLIALVAVFAIVWSALPLDHATITIDDETIALSGVEGWQAVLVVIGAAAAVLVGLVVAALAMVFAFGAAALGIVVAMVAVLASLAIVASPFLFVGWLIWLIVRPAARPQAAAA